MKPFKQIWIEDRRLAILRTLSDSPGQIANSSTLHTVLVSVLSITCQRAEVLDDLRVMEGHGLVTMTQLSDHLSHLYAITLTGRGDDVARGLLLVEGISRPRRGG